MSDDENEVSANKSENQFFICSMQPHVIPDQPYDESMDVRNLWKNSFFFHDEID